MNLINTQYLKVPIDNSTLIEFVTIKQGEILSRRVEITLTENEVEYTIPSGIKARINYCKPDGEKVVNDCEISRNRVIVEYTEQMALAAGVAYGEIQLYKGNTVLISATYRTKVLKSAGEEVEEKSTSESTSFTALLTELTEVAKTAEEAIQEVQEATKNAQIATTNAEKKANTAITEANKATTEANAATKKTNTATIEAKEAAERAKEAEENAKIAASSVYTDRDFLLLRNEDGTLTLTFDEQE